MCRTHTPQTLRCAGWPRVGTLLGPEHAVVRQHAHHQPVPQQLCIGRGACASPRAPPAAGRPCGRARGVPAAWPSRCWTTPCAAAVVVEQRKARVQHVLGQRGQHTHTPTHTHAVRHAAGSARCCRTSTRGACAVMRTPCPPARAPPTTTPARTGTCGAPALWCAARWPARACRPAHTAALSPFHVL